MNYIVNRIDLDVHDAGAQAWINVRQNETNRKICIALTESGEPFALTEDCDAVFAGTKPDATVFFNSCEITGNTIEYVLTGQNLAQTGDLKCEIRLYGSGNTLICSPRFVVHVQENAVDDNGIESADEFSELTELISEAREATDAANASVITGATASVDSNVGTPEVELTLTQEENGQSMDFEFHNLKGETGDPGVHVGDTAPTNPAISLWIDTDDNGASQVLSVMGTFVSFAALQAAVTNPNNGDSYGVGAAAPYDIYRYDAASGEWINYGNYKGDTGPQGPTGPTGAAGTDGFSPTATVTKSGSVATITITDKNGTTTATVSDGEVTQEQLDTKAPAITETTESSAIANFTDGADNMVMHNVVVEINPVQSGSGDPSPSNIRPITGHTEVNVTRTGKNLFDKSAILAGHWIVANTTTIEAQSSYFVSDYIPVEVGKPITCTAKGASRSIYYDKNKNPIEYFSWNIGVLNPLHDGYIRTTGANNYFDTLQIQLGSSATAYEAPQVQTVTVDWQTEAGTVYGGTIDVATGLLTVDRAMVDLGTLTWVASETGSGRYYAVVNGIKLATSRTLEIICSCFKPNVGGGAFENCSIYNVDSRLYAVNNNIIDDVSGFTESVTEQVAVYPLATPQTYQLTPQEVKTLLGTNNVWADTGDVTVTYPADTKMFIEKLTMPTEDDLVANQAITSGKYFMIGNSLYLALANIASGAAITIGTNAQRVSLADALNTINS